MPPAQWIVLITARTAAREKSNYYVTETPSREELSWGFLLCLMRVPARDFAVLMERAHFLTDGASCQGFFYQNSHDNFDGMTI